MAWFNAILVGLVFILFFPLLAFAEETVEDAFPNGDEVDDELKYLQEETYVITPSRIPQRIEKAPGSIYVVTDKEIRDMGARYLSDVLETVPAWYAHQNYTAGKMPSARGVTGYNGNQILFMVNSQIWNNPWDGSASGFLGLDLDNVKRIEFVTGPGSALYGSGAMAGIVNVITKDGKDVDGLQLTARGGSYNTWEGNALFGKEIEGLEMAAYLDYYDTDGFRGRVNEDQQSLLDQRWGTQGSLAPGDIRGDEDRIDAQLTLKYKSFKFDGKYFGRKCDTRLGFRPILDNMSQLDSGQYYLNLSYEETVTEGLNILTKVYRNQYSDDSTFQIYPKGSLVATPKGPVILSDDKFINGTLKQARTGGEAQTTYEIVDTNTLVGGISLERMEVYDVGRTGNYLNTSQNGVIIPLPTVEEWPSDLLMPESERDFWAAYIEDLWDITDGLRLTIGGRYDHYSDVGGELSPRVGVNWDFAKNYYTKFLYGRAFRAPTFRELYDPVYGNANLKPVTRDSYELSFGLRFIPAFTAEVTGYFSESENAISPDMSGSPPSLKYVNLGKGKAKGGTLQMKYDFGRGTYLEMNYTYDIIDIWDSLGEPVVAYWQPRHLGTLGGNIRLNRYLNLNAYLLYRGGWSRSNDDTRPDPDDYAIVNATLIARNFLAELNGLEVRAAVKNLFNKDYTSPTGPGELPDDLPMPGINFFLELRYTF
ncbi:MAG: TonB-dependent receptor [Deltaproteobacteria bacterium]|nr:TonB-dependent receptor [Deltaproteobacteria bacterium]